ncbi:acyltransferase 3 [Mycena rosella]|uniref:Acyltransferase 3 n=1 Tax=Mycena rosella TaxID=1033263 RepID=A0AAD7GH43_MYCRO|nr:acyltransferase 3 [Mycena rosella]
MSRDPEGELAALLPRLIRETRIHFLDNLRSSLIALVIFHHAALPFGGVGSWPYSSPYHTPESSLILSLFIAVNQTYFMALLFFISGHWSAVAATNKTWDAFCLDKLKRLGIPVVVYTLLLHPLVLVLVRWSQHAAVVPALVAYWSGLNGVRGPVWFIAVLLFFDLIYIAVRTCLPPFSFLLPTSAARFKVTAVVGISLVIVSSFLIRLSHPVGRASPPLELQLAYAPQYVFAYISGTCLSYIQQYFLVSRPGRALVISYLVAILSITALAIPFKLTSHLFFGGANPVALFYAIWNELCFYFIGTALFSLFHDSEYATRRWGSTARYSYAAFLLHPIVVVALQVLVDSSGGAALNGVIKTLAVGALGVCLSWAAGWAVVQIPGVGKII